MPSATISVKSDLQKRLEGEGWELLTNLSDSKISHTHPECPHYNYLEDLKRQGMEVKLASAYDCEGKLIQDASAVYARAKK
jgi:hypothetical protein